MNAESVRRIGHLQSALHSSDGGPVNITIDAPRLSAVRVLCDYVIQPAAWFLVWALLAKITGISL